MTKALEPKTAPLNGRKTNPARLAAQAAGLKRYISFEPCTQGHVGERYVVKDQCVACIYAYAAKKKGRTTAAGRGLHPLYSLWANLFQRCYNPKDRGYKNYGGRGIKVCERWREFANFVVDIGPRPTPAHTLDRQNNDGDYEPDNCRWATHAEQRRNSRQNVYFVIGGARMVLTDVARMCGVTPQAFGYQVRRRGGGEAAVAYYKNKERHREAAA